MFFIEARASTSTKSTKSHEGNNSFVFSHGCLPTTEEQMHISFQHRGVMKPSWLIAIDMPPFHEFISILLMPMAWYQQMWEDWIPQVKTLDSVNPLFCILYLKSPANQFHWLILSFSTRGRKKPLYPLLFHLLWFYKLQPLPSSLCLLLTVPA